MAVGYKGLPVLPAIAGVRLGIASAGIKKPGRRDITVMALDEGCEVAAVFTRNAFCAAPVTLAKRHLGQGAPRYLLVNTGNANAGTGAAGMVAAEACCEALATVAGCQASEILPFSTGVIGEPLPVEKISTALPAALADLRADSWADAAHAIMTTDTVAKGATRSLLLRGKTVTVTGIAKGSGMIRPDMATMLAYVATDAAVDGATLQQVLTSAVATSFNRITVDGDTSTNDACVLIATQRSGVTLKQEDGDFAKFQQAITEVCEELAQLIIRDGEGATKLITIDVRGGRSVQECEQVAYTIAHSPLVKTAFFASDPNWGRILAAVGRAGVTDMDLAAITLFLGDVCIVRNGGRDPAYREELGAAVMKQAEITIRVELARGAATARVWTCDFSYDYVKINAEYRS
ncbi:MAG TPA: bifunctional glutamate N-acetyltransferase/amino-acid acetyltransferase ArgJ [Gammaproteobacteria bacterium]